MKRFARAIIVGAVASWALAASPVSAEEGLWTFDAFPTGAVQRSLGVRVDRNWLDHLRAGSVRLTSGCSAALVSSRGLAVTNQHCVLGCIQSLSGAGRDRLAEGFGIGADEPPRVCPGLQAEILVGIQDITGALFRASRAKYGDAFVRARETVLTQAERAACGGDPRFRCQAISFFGGGQFKVYKYRRYDDVRLVFAPEFPVAFFGGDPENFSFPRYDLDTAVLRLYEKGAPAVARDWLSWSDRAPMDGEAVFVSGSPGTTERALTVAQMETLRDVADPDFQRHNRVLRDRLRAFAALGPDERRLATDRLFEAENALKVVRGQIEVLSNPEFMAARRADEASLKATLASDPRLAARLGDPWAEITALRKTYADRYPVWRRLEEGAGSGSRLFGFARTLVRAAAERDKPPPDRLPEYSEARMALLEKSVLDDQPVDPRLERLCLLLWLEETRAVLGPGAAAATQFLGSETPEAVADRLVAHSRLGDPAVRAALWKGGSAAVLASDDPMILYVLKTDPLSRAARHVWEDDVLGPIESADERVTHVRFLALGPEVYPDATFSPRVSFGRVEGWSQGDRRIAPFTTLGGLYAHATDADPLRLPARWLNARGNLDPGQVLNFVTTNDIVGGNSGSPVVDAHGRMVGAAFDGNQASLAGAFAYDGRVNRTVVVSTAAIDEVLAKVYGRADLVRELRGGPLAGF